MEALLTGFNFGLIAILFIPGFIFVQIVEKHLLREKKAQFEKTLEIFLISLFIWAISGILPFGGWPYTYEKNQIYDFFISYLRNSDSTLQNVYLTNGTILSMLTKYFLAICTWTFLVANIWGLIRKSWRIDLIISTFIGRNWYPNVSFQFYKENIERPIEYTINEVRYIGILHNAPDTIDDDFIMIRDVHQFVKFTDGNNQERFRLEKLLSVNKMLLKISEIKELKAHDGSIISYSKPKNKWSILCEIFNFKRKEK